MKKKITGSKIILKILSPEDVTDKYLTWMQDEEVVKYTESRWSTYTIESLKEYIKKINNGEKNYFFGIFYKENNNHIGNIKIGNINHIHKHADIGILIGDKRYWGRGIATEALILASEFAFKDLTLNKLFAGINVKNMGSYKAFIKAGYNDVGTYRRHVFIDGEFNDVYIVEKLNY